MGCFNSSTNNDLNKNVDKLLKEKHKEAEFKLLLLGTGGSGKSTFLKQLKVIHKGGFSTREIDKFRIILRNNALTNMRIICDRIEDIENDIENEDKYYIDQIMETDIDTE